VVAQIDEFKSVLRYSPTATPVVNKVILDCSFDDIKGSDGSFRCVSDELAVPKALLASPEEAQALFVTLFSFKKSGGCVIGISLHHHVGDGSAQFSFVKAWCNEAKGTTAPTAIAKIHDRLSLPKSPSPPSAAPAAYRYITNKGKPATFLPANSALIRFPSKGLAELKAKVAASIPPPLFVSTNDVLLAVLFRATVRAQGLAHDEPVYMKVRNN